MLVRREWPDDHDAVRAVVAAAFATSRPSADQDANPGLPVEVVLLEALRLGEEWIPALSLVAEDGAGAVVGHVICTRAWVGGEPVVALGPLAVAPGSQRVGVGSALVHAVLGAADALEEPLVALLGHLDFYPRFGFRPASELGVEAPVPSWGAHFQVRTLAAYRSDLRGPFRYAGPFEDL